jgi:hypothetical protein
VWSLDPLPATSAFTSSVVPSISCSSSICAAVGYIYGEPTVEMGS